jgi:hypothetical protein
MLKTELISAHFWHFRRHRLIAYYRCFGTTYRSHLSRVKQFSSSWTVWLLKMGPTACPETSVTSYPPTLRKTPEEVRILFTPRRKAEIT